MLTNSGMGIVEAYLAGSPMLVIADLSDGFPFTQHGPYQSGSGDFGSWDARDTIRGYTKEVFVARDTASAVQSTQLALKHATTGQPGPVALLFHSAAPSATVGPDTTPRLYATKQYLSSQRQSATTDDVSAAVETLAGASKPVIIAGNGVRMSAAQSRLLELAELLGAPVATTASGKGTFPETHPLALGVFGNFGLEAANVTVADADLVVAVGTKLGPTDTANENPALLDPGRQVFLQVDVEHGTLAGPSPSGTPSSATLPPSSRSSSTQCARLSCPVASTAPSRSPRRIAATPRSTYRSPIPTCGPSCRSA